MEKVPTVTAQERRVRAVKGKPVFYDSPRIKSAKALFVAHLKQHRPPKPYDSGVRLRVSRLFPKGRHKDGEYRITKPKKANSPISGIKTTSLPVKNTEKNSINGKFAVGKSVKSDIIKIEKQCFIHQDKINKFFLKPGAKHAQEFFDVGYSTEDYELINADLVGGFDYSKAIDKQIDKNGVEKFSIFMNLGTKEMI